MDDMFALGQKWPHLLGNVDSPIMEPLGNIIEQSKKQWLSRVYKGNILRSYTRII